MNDKIYYFSNLDNQIHNINDVKHYQDNEITIDILDSESYVIDTVCLYTLEDIMLIVNRINVKQ